MSRAILVTCNEWAGLYVDGHLVQERNIIHADDVLAALLGKKLEGYETTSSNERLEAYLEYHTCMPQTEAELREVKNEWERPKQ